MYAQLASQLGVGVTAQGANFNTARNNVGAAYDDMTKALTTQANATATGLGNQFNMLGIGAATDAATQDLRGQLNQSLVSAARRKATEMSGMSQQGAAYKAAGIENVGNVRREGVQVRGDYRTRLEEAIANLEAAKAEAQGQYDVQKLQGEAQLAQMAAQARARSGGGGGRSGSPLDQLRAQLLGMQILEKQQKMEEGPESQWGKRGQGGLDSFLNSPSNYWSGGAGPKVRGALQDIISGSFSQANNPSSIASGMKDPYNIAMGMVNQNDMVKTDFYRDSLRQALQIYYGKA
jgi:hypothetical protein